MKTVCYSLVLLFFFVSCEKHNTELPEQAKSTLIYMIADNNLDYYAVSNIKEMELGLPEHSSGKLFVFIDRNQGGKPAHPILYEVKRDTVNTVITSTILKTYEEQNSCNPQCFREVVADVQHRCATQNTQLDRLVLWSHGTGWLPAGAGFNEYDNIAPLSFGLDNTECSDTTSSINEMDIKQLAKALDGFHFDLLLMDACFMGCIEVAYELKNHFDHMILSPSEVLSTGFPYKNIACDLVGMSLKPEAIAEKFFNYYNSQENALQSATIAVVNTEYLSEFARKMKSIYKLYSTVENKSGIVDTVPQYDRTISNYFFDLENFVTQVSTITNSTNSDIAGIWSNMLSYYRHTQTMFSTLNLSQTTGLSVYIPNNYEQKKDLHDYYKTLKWAQDCEVTSLLD